MSEQNPILVDEPRTGLTSGVVGTGTIDKNATGTGLFSDAANAIRDGADGNWGGFAIDAVAGGLDYLSFVEDPLQGLLSAGIGWLIEHISFLSEPLDYLAGNADLVTEKAQTWKNISQALQRSSQDYSTSAQALTAQYQGPASSAYAASAKNFADLVATTGKHADNAANAMSVAGAIVGTTRGIVRDLISQFVAQAVEKWIITAATSWFDFGASIPIFIGDEVYEASITAEKVSGRLTQLARELKELEDAARNGAKGLDTTIAAVKRSIRSEAGWATRSTRAAATTAGTSAHTAEDLFKAAERSRFHPGDVKPAIVANRQASADVQRAIEAAQLSRSAATGAGVRATEQTTSRTVSDLQAQLAKLTEQRAALERGVVNHPLGGGYLPTPSENSLPGRIGGFKHDHEHAVDAGEEAGRQGTGEQPARDQEGADRQEQRRELPDGTLVE
jgi:hypothetical protein